MEEINVLGLTIQPKYDILNRPKGKTLCIDGEKLAEEQIVYRKHGDHATDMPSAVYFGAKTAGMYALNEHVKYAYDERGNIQKVFENGVLVARYEYDTLNRLVREDDKKFGKTRLFTYDNNGNILSKRETEFTLKTDVEECTFTRIDYVYDGDRLISYNGQTFAYDAVGNPTTYRGNQTAWTMGKLTAYGNTTFTYDMQGRRLTKGDISFAYDGNGNLITQSDGLLFLYDHTGVAGVQYDGRIYLYRKDAQGNIIAILDDTGKVVVRYAYNAWGGHTVEVVDSDCADIAYKNPFRYRGYYYDTETGLYYLHARYYDPTTGRFISPDGIEYLDPESINGLNLYAYCGNNPVMYADPSGHLPEWIADFGRFFGGLLISIVSIGLIGTTIRSGGLLCLLPGYGTLLQAELSLMMYGGFVMASSWDPLIQSDMEAINWNPFNSNPDMSKVNKVSFYKGEAVIIQGFAGNSFSFGVMFLQKGEKHDINTVNHEWGHFAQLALHGPAVFTLFMALPSVIYNIYCRINGDWDKYYEMPWEVYADYLGGVKR